MITEGTLVSTGWVGWSSIVDLVGDDLCLWTDLGGLHSLVPLPSSLPVGATHLWAWRPGRWTRVRLDGGRALATAGAPSANAMLRAATRPSDKTSASSLVTIMGGNL